MFHQLTLRWYGEPVGKFTTGPGLLIEDFEFCEPFGPDIIPSNEQGIPSFLANLRPQGMMSEIFNDNVYKFRQPVSRFLSNMTITNGGEFEVKPDVHKNRLSDEPFSNYLYFGETPNKESDFLNKIKRYWSKSGMPRYSGVETKIPVNIENDEIHISRKGRSFTHFLKIPPNDYRDTIGFNEWFCLQLAESIEDFPTSNNSMIFLDEEENPSFLSERYDITDDPEISGEDEDLLWRMSQDICTLNAEDFSEAGNGSYEKMAKTIKSFSNNWEQDAEIFYKRMILTWAVRDTDFHKKNISMLFKYDPEKAQIQSCRIAPAYDITSDVYNNEENHGLSLTLGGKRTGFKRKTFIQFGQNLGLDKYKAEEMLDQTLATLSERSAELSQHPDIPNDDCKHVARRIATFVHETARKFDVPTSEWEDEPLKTEGLPSCRIGGSSGRMTLEYM